MAYINEDAIKELVGDIDVGDLVCGRCVKSNDCEVFTSDLYPACAFFEPEENADEAVM